MVDKLHDVRMIEPLDGFDFACKPPGSFRIGYALERKLPEKHSRAIPHAQDMGLATLAEIVADPLPSFSVNARHG